jgi:hypothetical protein
VKNPPGDGHPENGENVPSGRGAGLFCRRVDPPEKLHHRENNVAKVGKHPSGRVLALDSFAFTLECKESQDADDFSH